MTASIRMRRYGIRVVAEPSGDTSRERLEGLTDKTIHSARNPPPEINREPCPAVEEFPSGLAHAPSIFVRKRNDE